MLKKLLVDGQGYGVLEGLKWDRDLSQLPLKKTEEAFLNKLVLFKANGVVFSGVYDVKADRWNDTNGNPLQSSEGIEICVVDLAGDNLHHLYDFLLDKDAFMLDFAKDSKTLFDVIQHNRLDNMEVSAMKGMGYSDAIHSGFIEHLNHRSKHPNFIK
ncbi:hypothetical protein [Aliivibrio finisterrensis]|uniref:Uncharacterized protein n=1 Tax=Aliivibrio finisterrensis TaxID=511998 RepID=A0ABY0IA78_9GAMM|nr:hypothetical protein [Aliivibrio finisterrensis]RYU64328.1 hypothetical protein ERW53_10345 [Aliivibrio finisterrensis]RYU83940.1 hypothetical protein ERW52_12185 [Aliivibrio finisterrensis]